MGFFVNGMLGGYGALMSELYPTAARATAQNVLFNIGRAVGGFGPLVVGALASAYSWQVAIALLAAIYVLDVLATAPSFRSEGGGAGVIPRPEERSVCGETGCGFRPSSVVP